MQEWIDAILAQIETAAENERKHGKETAPALMGLARLLSSVNRFSLEVAAANIKRHSEGTSQLLESAGRTIAMLADHRRALINGLAYALATVQMSVSQASEIMAHVNGYGGTPNMESEIQIRISEIMLAINPDAARDRLIDSDEVPF